jgi:hypothetical protein
MNTFSALLQGELRPLDISLLAQLTVKAEATGWKDSEPDFSAAAFRENI